MAQFEFSTTADEASVALADEIKDKTVLITGISPKVIGTEAAKAIAKHKPALLIFTSRTPVNVEKVISDIRESTPDVKIRSLQLDLANQMSVREAAKEVNGYTANIHIVVNNASIMAVGYALTPQGIKSQFGTNHIGHFLFTKLIMPKILATDPTARIVNVSSRGIDSLMSGGMASILGRKELRQIGCARSSKDGKHALLTVPRGEAEG